MSVARPIQRDRVGLALPAFRTAGGYFASRNRYYTAWGDLLLLLFTPIGSRPGKRDFGCALDRLLFEPDVHTRVMTVRHVITAAMTRWTPHIVLRQLQVRKEGKILQLRISISLVGEDDKSEALVEIHPDQIKVLGLMGT